MAKVFVTGGTGYLGQPLIERLAARGHEVRALVRPASLARLPQCAESILGDVLTPNACRGWIRPGDTVVHLVGVAHPSPLKAAAFDEIDARALQHVLASAQDAPAAHFIYVSVAHPAPVMRAYQRVRIASEQRIRESGLAHTFLRPWYVLGPGHWWPIALKPLYGVAERLPSTRPSALWLGLVWRSEMIDALVDAVETRPDRERILDVPDIRAIAGNARITGRLQATQSAARRADSAPILAARSGP